MVAKPEFPTEIWQVIQIDFPRGHHQALLFVRDRFKSLHRQFQI
jgi:hypothetical protein